MGNIHSCTSKGALLLVAAANGDLVTAQELLAKHPKAASYYNFKDRSSPLLQAAARGHFELVQLILETAVMTEGPERAKKNCIDHANSKRQTALMVACKHGHPDCVEYLVTNGGDPLLTDERRHNTCLHFAALYGHSECVHKLLGSRAAYRVQGRQVPVAQIPCVDDGVTIKFIDRHNGWGLSALHIAVFQGSVSTVRALLRHGADVESVISASKVENSPIRCAVGSNALHIAALTGNIIMAKLILETQESYPGLELRSRTNAAGLKPHDYAQSARNPVLMHLLDERLPVTLLRQIWMNYSLEQSLPPRTQTLGSMLQKLKLMFNLELIAIQRNVTHLQAQMDGAAQAHAHPQQQPHAQHTHAAEQVLSQRQGAAAAGWPPQHQQAQGTAAGTAQAAAGVAGVPAVGLEAPDAASRPVAALPALSVTPAQAGAGSLAGLGAHGSKHRGVDPVNVRLLWARRQDEITQLLGTVTQLHDNLKQLCRREEPAAGEGAAEAAAGLNRSDRAATYEAVLDFILSTLITPRTVSAILHAAKKLVSASVNGTAALTAGGAPMELPPGDSDSQHGLALLSTALRAVETCLQAAVYLTSPGVLEQQAAAAGARAGTAAVGGLPSGLGMPGERNAADPVVAANGSAIVLTVSPTEAIVATNGASALAAGYGAAAAAELRLAASRATGGAADVGSGGHGSAALVSDHASDRDGQRGGAADGAQGSPRTLPNGGGMPLSAAGLIFQQTAMRGVGDGISPTPAFAAHWSAHLHTLIAQLQWDIGVQRHRRRRAHAAAAAARSAAAAAAVVAATASPGAVANGGTAAAANPAGAQGGSAAPFAAAMGAAGAAAGHVPSGSSAPPTGAAEPTGPSRGSVAPGAAVGGGAEAADASAAAPSAVNLLRALNSRRGDAVQDVVTSQSGNAPAAVAPGGRSTSDSGVSTPMASAAEAATAAAGAGGGSVSVSTAANTAVTNTAEGPSRGVGDAHGAGEGGAAGGEDGAFQHPIGTDEIIPLVSGVLTAARGPSAAATAAPVDPRACDTTTASAVAGGGGPDHLTTGGTTGQAAAAAATAKRGAAKDRGKERDGAAGGDGGLDGQDDSPAASESGSDWSDDDRNVCSICMDLPVAVLVAGCQHGLCVQCAFQLCVKGRELPSCPFCRQKIGGFEAKEMTASGGATAMPAAGAATAAAAAPAGTAGGAGASVSVA